MRNIFKILAIALIINACSGKETDKYPIKQADWKSKQTNIDNFEDYFQGKTYLPVYSHIYHVHEHRTFDLTITVGIRNISLTDSVYILKADYFNTIGENIRQYIKNPIYLKPLETLEIIIEEQDIEGGSGANFVFDWAKINDKNPPLFEAVMISTYGQQGLSFTTRGVPIFE
ncbi:DUF3124 domain-containing protein [Labilibaculum euxinus]|uniref:DUF3124 domain-containing protein n=1 Tax=Labilibaculum euxinus TaxID=2686357 RepID=A0A7M4D8X1_9BACT|nr:DUF3124 domain-containing protein [Labilibaculum euxinus]MUP39100.1 DUF3124 domain-containing protein [Labilibaculum euxinus]MVB08305.1 DUF3124 domain-containing protein [Labilibaculum euxinus]